MRRWLFSLLLLSVITGCTTNLGAPLEANNDALMLSSDLDTTGFEFYESSGQGITVGYPNGWAIVGDKVIISIGPDEEQFSWGQNYSPAKPQYNLFTMGSYSDRSNRRMRIPQSAAIVLSELPKGVSGDVLQPVTSVDISGRDGATYLVGNEYRHKYYVAVRVTAHKAVILTAEGPAEKSE